ncbi:hypothetical protein [Microbacterium proteolyticum]|uniref:hypothetical protein n=1 Tax=Microbacterium proteolyticum TaxID=1572644 RepID=UPI001FAC941A|nr:hypothetical protein [Microbacterium proteolyticum]MCI9857847.1 hypothetical protein [Microbacterium proteolyticum]
MASIFPGLRGHGVGPDTRGHVGGAAMRSAAYVSSLGWLALAACMVGVGLVVIGRTRSKTSTR